MALRACLATLMALESFTACDTEIPGEPDAAEATGTGMLTVSVVGPNSADQRVEAAREAVRFWNVVFADLGLRRPFDTVAFLQQEIPEDLLAAYSRSVLEGEAAPAEPNAFTRVAADVVIALSDSAIISFAASLDGSGHWLVGIRTDLIPPLSLPNVPRNLVAHELGHVLGLGHNSDPTKLMCGRPAPCRPAAFQSSEPRFFELTEAERARLRELYGY
ncbi:MAG: hypothetical protein JSW71_03205 [Gemmatimonadota bacterium]|nr:MAG: hypothetical protein JSW71_03205 [Gemmatimonadota bacterium]